MNNLLSLLDNKHLIKSTRSFEYVGAILIALSSLLIFLVINIEVPSVWNYPLFVFFNIVSLFGICDMVVFNYNKSIRLNKPIMEVVNASTFFHLSIYSLLFAIAFSIITQ